MSAVGTALIETAERAEASGALTFDAALDSLINRGAYVPPTVASYHHAAPVMLDDVTAAYAYAAMLHTPTAPDVEASYAAFAFATLKQWREITTSHLTVEFHDGAHDYLDSAHMHADIACGHLWTRLSAADGLPADHPMLTPSGWGTEIGDDVVLLSLNDVFRAVHDVQGHYGRGGGTDPAARFSFGPQGERAAWLRHRDSYPAAALAALWCETRGQSAWVNDYADHRALPLASRPFAAQKSGRPPLALI